MEKEMAKTDSKYIGNADQLFDVKTYRLCGGRSEGVLCTQVDDGAGMNVVIAADKCMDMQQIRYKGYGTAYLGGAGTVSPAYFDGDGFEFLRAFTPGSLTTCGLTNTGSPCTDDGEELGLHGRIGNTPAEEYSVIREGDSVRIRGIMRQWKLFGENLTLKREYLIKYASNEIIFTDTVTNAGYRTVPHMQLYHFNFGYPFISEDARIYLPTDEVIPRSEFSRERMSGWAELTSPVDGEGEVCYYHKMRKNAKGESTAIIYNSKLNIGSCYRYDAAALDTFVNWKVCGSGEYVVGLEPGNGKVDGRDLSRQNGDLKFIEPGKSVECRFSLKFFEGKKKLERLIREQEEMR